MPIYTSFLEAINDFEEYINKSNDVSNVCGKDYPPNIVLKYFSPSRYNSMFDKWLLETNSSIIPTKNEKRNKKRKPKMAHPRKISLTITHRR